MGSLHWRSRWNILPTKYLTQQIFQTMYLICDQSWVWNLLLLSFSCLHKLFLLILHHLHLSKHIHVWSLKQCSLSMILIHHHCQWSLSDPSSASMATCCWAPMMTVFVQVVISSLSCCTSWTNGLIVSTVFFPFRLHSWLGLL